LRSLDDLTPSQIAAVTEHLGTREAIHTINAVPRPACPSCGGARGQRWGTTPAGIQRHRCSACHTTFTARTGTPLARVHQPNKLLALITDMLALRDVSCRAAARHLDVDHTTIWRWRYQVLAWMFAPAHLGQTGGAPAWIRWRASPAANRSMASDVWDG
jgi:transposase-like protein